MQLIANCSSGFFFLLFFPPFSFTFSVFSFVCLFVRACCCCSLLLLSCFFSCFFFLFYSRRKCIFLSLLTSISIPVLSSVLIPIPASTSYYSSIHPVVRSFRFLYGYPLILMCSSLTYPWVLCRRSCVMGN